MLWVFCVETLESSEAWSVQSHSKDFMIMGVSLRVLQSFGKIIMGSCRTMDDSS